MNRDGLKVCIFNDQTYLDKKIEAAVARDCWIGVSEFLDPQSYRNLLISGPEISQSIGNDGDELVWRSLCSNMLPHVMQVLPSGSSWRNYFRVMNFVWNKSPRNLPGAMRIAACCGYDFILQYLLSIYNVDVNDASDTDQTGFTQSGSRAIHQACKNGHLSTLHLLVDVFKAEPDALDHNGRTALMLASAHGHFDVCKYMIDRQCDVNVSAHFGFTALHFAAMMHYSSIVSLLLERGGSVRVRDQRGWTPLMVAISSVPRDMDLVRNVRVRQTLAHLLRNGADCFTPDCILTGKSVMDIAKSLGLLEIVSWMEDFVHTLPRAIG